MALIKMELYSECLTRKTMVNVIVPEISGPTCAAKWEIPLLYGCCTAHLTDIRAGNALHPLNYMRKSAA